MGDPISPPRAAGHERKVCAPPEVVRAELERILGSQEFRASRRCQEFLQYVVDTTLEGHADSLKERTIGIDVFHRTSSWDPSDDATVRVKAGEVRKRLDRYYAGEGREAEWRVRIPAGTYIPEFVHVAPDPAPASMPPGSPAAAGHASRGVAPAVKRRLWPLAVVSLLALAAIAGLYRWAAARPAGSVIEQFWAPVLRGPSPVLVCASYVPVYAPRQAGDMTAAPERPEDFVLLTDQFVGGGDMVTVSRLSAMLTRMQRAYRLKMGNDVTFDDLRMAPSILVGYSHTRWREISKDLRFYIDGSRHPLGVSDNGSPTKWSLPNMPADRRTDEDYAIVSRVFHPDTRAMLVELAGIMQYGTEAAGELVTNPDLLADALHGAPKGWEQRNLQIVLHVKVIAGTPAPPQVVAIHSW